MIDEFSLNLHFYPVICIRPLDEARLCEFFALFLTKVPQFFLSATFCIIYLFFEIETAYFADYVHQISLHFAMYITCYEALIPDFILCASSVMYLYM